MTWPSKRSLERDVEELRPREADTPREWLDALVNRSLREGDVEVHVSFADEWTAPPADETVVYASADGHEHSVPPEDIPEWIDEEEDLPVRGEPGERDPFVLADFRSTQT
jgi:hypothetical protein